MAKNKMIAICVGRNVSPKFQHDCTQCKFVAHIDGHDTYICPSFLGSIVLRYSSDGPKYSSLPTSCTPENSIYALVIKLNTMHAEGLITRNMYVTRPIDKLRTTM